VGSLALLRTSLRLAPGFASSHMRVEAKRSYASELHFRLRKVGGQSQVRPVKDPGSMTCMIRYLDVGSLSQRLTGLSLGGVTSQDRRLKLIECMTVKPRRVRACCTT